MSKEVCQFCGIEIEFRTIKGKPVPLHPTGSTCPGKRLYRDEERDVCHLTSCPKCGDPVYFIRHNGGCAWFDDLGKPWDKHAPCFSNDSVSPKGWGESPRKGWKVHYLRFEGPLTDGSGGVFIISRHPIDKRQWGTYLLQSKLQCPDCDPKMLAALDGKSVLFNKSHTRIQTMDGRIWEVSEHVPSYRKIHHTITRLY